jgi:hypothetical protein
VSKSATLYHALAKQAGIESRRKLSCIRAPQPSMWIKRHLVPFFGTVGDKGWILLEKV